MEVTIYCCSRFAPSITTIDTVEEDTQTNKDRYERQYKHCNQKTPLWVTIRENSGTLTACCLS